jgi:hypothetical protein
MIAFWLWKNMNPQFPNIMPREMIDAAKALTVAADKWGHVADACTGYLLPAIALFIVVVGFSIAVKLWGNR